MLLLMLTACSSSSTEEEPQKPKEKPVLKIYLFAPESPIITRADIGDVNASVAEKDIKTLDVWVFRYDTHDFISYIHLDNLSFDGQKEIAMEIGDEFANLPKKPEVDIYVAANASSLGLTLNNTTTLDDLKAACIGSSHFGVTSLITSVPDGPTGGLPMSGVLENQKISGIPPVYTVKTNNVKLVRAVSKVRFILSKSDANPPTITDLSIKFDAGVLPKEEYLFLAGVYPEFKSRVKATGDNSYEGEVTLVSGVSSDDINSYSNPAEYAYASETGQAYETKINEAIANNYVSQIGSGPFYLHESDKKLTGTISYTIGTTQKSVPFSMSGAGDFTRNHTWIVYGYFLGNGDLKLNVVDVKAWTEDSSNPKVYNW